MNCGTCRECKIKIWVFGNFGFLDFSKYFEKNRFFRQCFGFLGVFVREIVIFNIGFGFCVLNSTWEHRLKIFFDPQIENVRPPKIETFPRSANNESKFFNT